MTMHSVFSSSWFLALPLWWRHALADVRSSQSAMSADSLVRMGAQVAASEGLHTGQIRVCVESHLPRSYLWRFVRQGTPVKQLIRQRAIMLFAKLRVWDTAQNNGVLVYVLLAERAIEVVADRGLSERLSHAHWQTVVKPMQAAFALGEFESGLSQAVDAVTALLVQHFPRPQGGENVSPSGVNELPDAPVVL